MIVIALAILGDTAIGERYSQYPLYMTLHLIMLTDCCTTFLV